MNSALDKIDQYDYAAPSAYEDEAPLGDPSDGLDTRGQAIRDLVLSGSEPTPGELYVMSVSRECTGDAEVLYITYLQGSMEGVDLVGELTVERPCHRASPGSCTPESPATDTSVDHGRTSVRAVMRRYAADPDSFAADHGYRKDNPSIGLMYAIAQSLDDTLCDKCSVVQELERGLETLMKRTATVDAGMLLRAIGSLNDESRCLSIMVDRIKDSAPVTKTDLDKAIMDSRKDMDATISSLVRMHRAIEHDPQREAMIKQNEFLSAENRDMMNRLGDMQENHREVMSSLDDLKRTIESDLVGAHRRAPASLSGSPALEHQSREALIARLHEEVSDLHEEIRRMRNAGMGKSAQELIAIIEDLNNKHDSMMKAITSGFSNTDQIKLLTVENADMRYTLASHLSERFGQQIDTPLEQMKKTLGNRTWRLLSGVLEGAYMLGPMQRRESHISNSLSIFVRSFPDQYSDSAELTTHTDRMMRELEGGAEIDTPVVVRDFLLALVDLYITP